MREEEWKRLVIDGWYAIEVPGGAQYRYDDESETLEIQLPQQDSEQFFLARWAFNESCNSDREVAIDQLLRHFITESISKVIGKSINDWQYTDQSRGGRRIAQGFVPIDLEAPELKDTRWWIIRFEIAPDPSFYYFMHWNGPYSMLKPLVIKMLEWFEPIG